MSILGAVSVPHPPILLPAIGQGEERTIQATIDAYHEAMRFAAGLNPDVVVILSPHSLMYSNYFHVSPGEGAQGSFAAFGAPQVKISCAYDTAFTERLGKLAKQAQIPAGPLGNRMPELDHATMLPLYYLQPLLPNVKIVRIGLSGLSLKEHYRLGMLLAETAEQLGRKAFIIASGDLSHKLKRSGPYGFDPAGPAYDRRIMDVLRHARFDELFDFDEDFLSRAAECGHRSFTIMAGALDGLAVEAHQLSYEGPFGVGYGVCTFLPTGQDDSRHYLSRYDAIRTARRKERLTKEDSYVRLARAVVEHFVRQGSMPRLPDSLPEEMRTRRAGVFVSLQEHGSLRGCIGTIGPMYDNIAEEIRHNAVAACSGDPRFTPVTPPELPDLVYSVDVLGPMEPVHSLSDLDVKRYGVVVTKGSRTGLLLPNLDGVTTVEQQISIARQKAGIAEEEDGVTLERFEAVRHY
ncbi:MAG: AmmeMemoRadiSam system protein A [Succiniclasticum sp.]|jgi:MEMO1 family protein